MQTLKRQRGSSGPRKKVYKKKQLYSVSSIPKIVGKTSLNEIKCRDQFFLPSSTQAIPVYTALAYVTPTKAGLGLATGYTCISLIDNGSGPSQRVGQKVVIKSLAIKGSLLVADNADATDNGTIRIMVVYDKMPNGAAPATTEIFASIDTAGAYATMFESPIKIANKNRFVTLKDKYYNVNGQVPAIHFKYFIKSRMECVYKATTTEPVIGDVATGAVYLLVFMQANVFTHPPVIGDVHVRMRYYD